MFSAAAIGLIVAISSATWVYNWSLNRTGGNTKSAITLAGTTAVISFFVILTVVWTIDSMLG